MRVSRDENIFPSLHSVHVRITPPVRVRSEKLLNKRDQVSRLQFGLIFFFFFFYRSSSSSSTLV